MAMSEVEIDMRRELICGLIVVVADDEYLDSLRKQQHTVRQIIVHKNGDCYRTTKLERGFQPTLCGRCGAYAIDTGLMAEVMHDRQVKKLMLRSVQKVACITVHQIYNALNMALHNINARPDSGAMAQRKESSKLVSTEMVVPAWLLTSCRGARCVIRRVQGDAGCGAGGDSQARVRQG